MVKTTIITVTAVKQCHPLRVADLLVVGLNISGTVFRGSENSIREIHY